MANFGEVMRQLKRLCRARGTDYEKCESCPISDERICSFEISDIEDDEIERVEAAVMAWSAEHPEPEYETWREYLNRLYLGGLGLEYEKDSALIDNPIPANIAEKLGIEPKEE